MIAYKEIAQIKNVWGINPITGGYSYEENGRGYLCIDSVLLEKEEPVLDIVSVGEYVYVWYGCGRFKLYSGHTLLKVFEKKVFLLDGNIGGYIGYHIRDPKTFEASENILSISDGQPLLAQNVPLASPELLPDKLHQSDQIFESRELVPDDAWRISYQVLKKKLRRWEAYSTNVSAYSFILPSRFHRAFSLKAIWEYIKSYIGMK